MINFNFGISNPFSDRWNSLFSKSGLLRKYKAWEFNGYQTHDLIDIDFRLSFTGDHAGLQVMIGLFGYSLEFSLYDTRHWNDETNTWENYDE
jgi:hypothetical protein